MPYCPSSEIFNNRLVFLFRFPNLQREVEVLVDLGEPYGGALAESFLLVEFEGDAVVGVDICVDAGDLEDCALLH